MSFKVYVVLSLSLNDGEYDFEEKLQADEHIIEWNVFWLSYICIWCTYLKGFSLIHDYGIPLTKYWDYKMILVYNEDVLAKLKIRESFFGKGSNFMEILQIYLI